MKEKENTKVARVEATKDIIIYAGESVKSGVRAFGKIFKYRRNRAVIGIVGMTFSIGMLASAYVRLPEDEEVVNDGNSR